MLRVAKLECGLMRKVFAAESAHPNLDELAFADHVFYLQKANYWI